MDTSLLRSRLWRLATSTRIATWEQTRRLGDQVGGRIGGNVRFVPERPFDRNRGQHATWKALKVALEGLDGCAYYRLPIYTTGGFRRHEIDMVLVLRDYGVFALEVKGCRIENIGAIVGNVWMMVDWFRPEEAPCAQVDDQKFALMDLLRAQGLHGVPCVERVVLPFVTSEGWARGGFAGLNSTRIVWTEEDLTRDRMRAWLESVPGRRRLSDDEWARLVSLFAAGGTPDAMVSPASPGGPADGGAGPGPGVRVPRVRFIEHDGDPFSNEELLGVVPELAVGSVGYSYVVATGALERLRSAAFQPELQMVEPDDDEEAKPVLVFHKVLRHFVRQPSLRRFEERALLLRAVREVATDPVRRALLERDVVAWRDALVELDESGTDLGRGVPPELKEMLVREDLCEVLRDLQVVFRAHMRRQGTARNFEWVGREYLDTVFRPTELVVLEGFSRFTPLQELFIRRSVALGAKVVVVRPNRAEQSHAFEAIRTAHASAFEDIGHDVQVEETGFSSEGELRWLQKNLFADNPSPPPSERNRSVILESWPHRNLEVESAVRRVRRALDGDYRRDDVVVVVRDAETYVPLLLEEAELQGCPGLFRIPPRLLLLTPVGRFALGLYDAWEDGLHLDADLFETFLASGLLGARVQQTADAFRSVKEQLFTRCVSHDDWLGRLSDLREISRVLPAESRIPAAGVPEAVTVLWQEVLGRVVDVCTRLASAESRPVGAHIRLLLDELSRLDVAGMREAERQVLGQIRDALVESTDSASIELTTTEFGSVLLGMSQEREEFASEDDRRVSVVGAESLDGVRKAVVLALGVDDSRVPRPPSESWPMEGGDFEQHLGQERYLFLATVRAAKDKIVFSYAQTDSREVRFPSMYLGEVSALLGRVQESSYQAPAHVVSLAADSHPGIGRARRQAYDFGELARFRLCPYRYKLERIDVTSSRYDNAFQLAFAAQGSWIEAAFGYLANAGRPTDSRREDVEEWFNHAFRTTGEEALAMYPALRDTDRVAIRQSLLHTRDFLVGWIVKKNYPAGVRHLVVGDVELVVDERPVSIAVPIRHALVIGSFVHPLFPAISTHEWLIDGPKPESGVVDVEVRDGVEVMVSQYDVVTWWRESLKAVFYAEHGVGAPFRADAKAKLVSLRQELVGLVRTVEAGNYPKNPGDHCRYCPAFTTCLGRLP